MKKYREQKKIPLILALKKLGRYRKLSGERKPESLTNKGLSGGDVSKGDKLISKKARKLLDQHQVIKEEAVKGLLMVLLPRVHKRRMLLERLKVVGNLLPLPLCNALAQLEYQRA